MDQFPEYTYDLPRDLIAQRPDPRGREFARLLIVNRAGKSFSEERFGAITDLFRAGDALVFNDTKVLPGRVFGRKPGGGDLEMLFLYVIDRRDQSGQEEWRALVRPARRLRSGLTIDLGLDTCAVLRDKKDGIWQVEVHSGIPFREWLDIHGMAPLPPYIKRKGGERQREDRADYQTVFARGQGSIAAPTAGLHFTGATMQRLREKGIRLFFLTLRLGPFEFLQPRGMGEEELPPEDYEIPPETAEGIEAVRNKGGRVCAVGTTTVRALEANARELGRVRPIRGEAEICIRPGHRFLVVDALVTNFHRPGSSMLALTCAFGGKELVLSAYRFAVEEKFRFLSLGDAMVIL